MRSANRAVAYHCCASVSINSAALGLLDRSKYAAPTSCVLFSSVAGADQLHANSKVTDRPVASDYAHAIALHMLQPCGGCAVDVSYTASNQPHIIHQTRSEKRPSADQHRVVELLVRQLCSRTAVCGRTNIDCASSAT